MEIKCTDLTSQFKFPTYVKRCQNVFVVVHGENTVLICIPLIITLVPLPSCWSSAHRKWNGDKVDLQMCQLRFPLLCGISWILPIFLYLSGNFFYCTMYTSVSVYDFMLLLTWFRCEICKYQYMYMHPLILQMIHIFSKPAGKNIWFVSNEAKGSKCHSFDSVYLAPCYRSMWNISMHSLILQMIHIFSKPTGSI